MIHRSQGETDLLRLIPRMPRETKWNPWANGFHQTSLRAARRWQRFCLGNPSCRRTRPDWYLVFEMSTCWVLIWLKNSLFKLERSWSVLLNHHEKHVMIHVLNYDNRNGIRTISSRLPVCTRTEVLVNGFKAELEQRLGDIKKCRVELERLFALRIDDEAIDRPENSQNKEDCMKAIRSAEGAFTSYSGSVRSIKGVIDACSDFNG